MKVLSRKNGGDLVNNESAGLVVYQITTIPSRHIFYNKETQFTILYITYLKAMVSMKKRRNNIFSNTDDGK